LRRDVCMSFDLSKGQVILIAEVSNKTERCLLLLVCERQTIGFVIDVLNRDRMDIEIIASELIPERIVACFKAAIGCRSIFLQNVLCDSTIPSNTIVRRYSIRIRSKPVP